MLGIFLVLSLAFRSTNYLMLGCIFSCLALASSLIQLSYYVNRVFYPFLFSSPNHRSFFVFPIAMPLLDPISSLALMHCIWSYLYCPVILGHLIFSLQLFCFVPSLPHIFLYNLVYYPAWSSDFLLSYLSSSSMLLSSTLLQLFYPHLTFLFTFVLSNLLSYCIGSPL